MIESDSIQQLVAERLEQLGNDTMTISTAEMSNPYNTFSKLIFILAISCTLILTAIYSVKDKIGKTLPLIISTKTGRNFCAKQFGAVIIGATIFSAVFSAVLIGSVFVDAWSEFYSQSINSFYSVEIYWFDMNHWQYVLMTIGIAFFVNIAFSVICFALIRNCGNYISALSAVIPLIIVVVILYFNPLSEIGMLGSWQFEELTYIVALIIAAVSMGMICRKQYANANLM